MAKSSVSNGFTKCFILFMAIVILVEGAAYLGLGIWGLNMSSCSSDSTNIEDAPFDFALDILYFIDQKCGDPVVEYSKDGVIATAILQVDWSKSEVITYRMNVFIITYIAVSALWVITSVLVIITLCCRVTTLVWAFCFWPWFVVVIAGSVLDVVATGYHIHDIVETTSVEDTFNYVGITQNSTILPYLTSFDSYFIIPAVVMTCISSRMVLIWLLNIFGVSFCLSLARALSKSSRAKHDRDRLSNTSTVTPTPQHVIARPAVSAAKQHESDQFRQQMPLTEQPASRPISFQNMSANRNLNARSAQQTQSPVAVYPPIVALGGARNDNFSRDATAANEGTTYRNTETHPDRLNYPPSQPPLEIQSTSPSQLSPISPLNHRYSSTEGLLLASQNQPQSRASEELRSQLPWSYTSALNKPQPPRKPQVQVYPEIPEPDYATQGSPTAEPATSAQQAYSRF